MKAECKGMNVQVIYADHHNKPDVGLAIARKWIDQGSVNAMVDLTNSAIALGVAGMLKKNPQIIGLFSGSGTTKLTNEACVPNGCKWMYNTYSLAVAAIHGLKQSGVKSIYFITADRSDERRVGQGCVITFR